MTKQEFIDWLDTVIPLGCSDWEIREEFDDGTILVAFTNVSDEEDDADDDSPVFDGTNEDECEEYANRD